MALVRRRPVTDLVTMRDMFDRFFDDGLARPSLFDGNVYGMRDMPIDVLEEGDNIVVTASVPGVKPDALHVEVEDDTLRIWAESKEETERKDEDYFIRERRFGRVERFVSLPYHVNSDKAKAEFEDGVLNLTLPKAAEALRKEIKVNAKA